MKSAALSPSFLPSLPPLPASERGAVASQRGQPLVVQQPAVEPFELPLGWRSEAFAEDLLESGLAPAYGDRRVRRGRSMLRRALAMVLRRR